MKKGNKTRKVRVPPPKSAENQDWYAEGSRTFQVELITVDLIRTEDQLVRIEMDSDHVIELSNSISVNGLLEPIVVRQTGDYYQLIAGAHRLAACKRIGWSLIPANILPESNETPIKSLALIENIVRRDLSLEEQCLAVQTLHEEQNLSVSQICDLLGKTRLWVQQRIFAPKMPADVRDPLFEGMLSMKVAEMICEVDDEGVRKTITNQAIYQKLAAHAVRQVVDLYKETPSIGAAIEKGLQSAAEIQSAPAPTTQCGACGQRKDYRKLRPIFICLNDQECQSHIMQEVKNAD